MVRLFPTWASSVVRAAQLSQHLVVCVWKRRKPDQTQASTRIFLQFLFFFFASTKHFYFKIYKLKSLFAHPPPTPPYTHTPHIPKHTQTPTYAHSWGQLVKLKRLHFSFECSMIRIIGINKAVSFGRDGSFWHLFPAPSQLVSGEETTKQGSH